VKPRKAATKPSAVLTDQQNALHAEAPVGVIRRGL